MGCLDLEISKSVEFDMIEAGDFNVGENERGTNVVFVGAAAPLTTKQKGRFNYNALVSKDPTNLPDLTNLTRADEVQKLILDLGGKQLNNYI
ncbi:hypothetical protein CMV_004609 [Castanea mollissima]|uniref:Uncharacterized protein n=1 Tax=Castanea mollissima TaxID=60419 RepID=A0A8J4W4U1_9ROSI|nr:hypothetical protein CMV_004609 [Castanea mollissima]